MFMLKSTHREIVDEMRGSYREMLIEQEAEIAVLRAELACRQVIAVRSKTTGRFEKREG